MFRSFILNGKTQCDVTLWVAQGIFLSNLRVLIFVIFEKFFNFHVSVSSKEETHG